jgi:tetratricopeptide (TPR) repeat protein
VKLFALDDLRLEPLHAGDAPLMLPDFLPSAHIEEIIRLWWRSLGQPRRVDLVWQPTGGPDRAMLKRLAQGALGNDVLVVVQVEDENIHLDELRASDDLRGLPKVALRCSSCAPGLSLRVLFELRRVVREALLSRWEEEGARLGLDPAALDPLEPLLRELLDPCEVVEAVNLVADGALAGVGPEVLTARVEADVLRRQLKALSGPEAEALLRWATAATVAADQAPAPQADARLRVQGLLRDGALQGWSRRLIDHRVYSRVFEGWSLRDPTPDPEAVAAQEGAARTAEAHAEVLRRRWADPRIEALADRVNDRSISPADARAPLAALRSSIPPTAAAKCDLHFVEGLIEEVAADWKAAGDAFLKSANEADDFNLQSFGAPAWHRYGVAKFKLGELEEAERALRHTLTLQDSHAWHPCDSVYTLEDLALVQAARSALNEAIHTLSRALGIALEPASGAPPWMVPVLFVNRGQLHNSNGDWRAAVIDFEHAVNAFKGLDRPKDLVTALMELGRTLNDHADWAQAEPHLRQAVTLSAEIKDDGLRWRTMGHLGIGLQRAGRNREAEELLCQSLAMRVDEGSGQHAAQVGHLALALSAQGDGTAAATLIDENWGLHRADWPPVARLDIANTRAIVAGRLGRQDEAITWFKLALEEGRIGTPIENRWVVITNLARLLANRKDAAGALSRLSEAERDLGAPPASLVAQQCGIRAAAYVLTRNFTGAARAARLGIETEGADSSSETSATLYFWLGEALHQLGHHHEAAAASARARDLASSDKDRVQALRSLAASLHALNKHGPARKAEREANELAPKKATAPRTQLVARRR